MESENRRGDLDLELIPSNELRLDLELENLRGDLDLELITDELRPDLELELITDELRSDLELELITDELRPDLELETRTAELRSDVPDMKQKGRAVTPVLCSQKTLSLLDLQSIRRAICFACSCPKNCGQQFYSESQQIAVLKSRFEYASCLDEGSKSSWIQKFISNSVVCRGVDEDVKIVYHINGFIVCFEVTYFLA